MSASSRDVMTLVVVITHGNVCPLLLVTVAELDFLGIHLKAKQAHLV